MQPNAFTVPGYPAELMPATHADPARLTPTEVRALVLFLMTLGGTPDRKALAAAEKRRPIPASDADAPAEKK
ncbi:MAG: hypothetical protein HZA54_19335 [Planctomycetes bacterium]|nr:hypothetical protein [Planctomycetota bacterium]